MKQEVERAIGVLRTLSGKEQVVTGEHSNHLELVSDAWNAFNDRLHVNDIKGLRGLISKYSEALVGYWYSMVLQGRQDNVRTFEDDGWITFVVTKSNPHEDCELRFKFNQEGQLDDALRPLRITSNKRNSPEEDYAFEHTITFNKEGRITRFERVHIHEEFERDPEKRLSSVRKTEVIDCVFLARSTGW